MNSPKVYLAMLMAAVIVLTILSFSLQQKNVHEFNAKVTANTLTQSLDGQRRYLNIITQTNEPLLIHVVASLYCPVGSDVRIQKETTSFGDEVYKVLHCNPE
ncbi:hypothetical protein AB2S62_21565 [Vibrio sp. NTOU-M3]|uniref:hypothetical protein n=1 Tax=Vibrio sp. NTOU-M3 TaxID=3234954 RepID=UPI00349FCF2B